tara:strand:+ start:2161 stop:2769 length:609 start_codon:yes stop_codon:yes gene_type:complete
MTTKKKVYKKKTQARKTKKHTSSVNPYVKTKSRKISIPIDWNATDSGYSALQTQKVFDFLVSNVNKGYNLIQTQPGKVFHAKGKTVLHLQAIRVTKWPISAAWDLREASRKNPILSCASYNDWIKTPPCNTGAKRAKIFTKMKSNTYIGGFGVYLWRIFSGELDVKKHKVFVKALKKTFRDKPIMIHNTDVDWFHAKQELKL